LTAGFISIDRSQQTDQKLTNRTVLPLTAFCMRKMAKKTFIGVAQEQQTGQKIAN
jgi:hypothetical protein